MNETSKNCYIVMFIFVGTVFINWLYVLWVKASMPNFLAAWFYLIPLMSYFYFTFALIATLGLCYKKKFGITIAFAVILGGATSAAITCNFAYRDPFIVSMFVLLMAIDLCAVLYFASKRRYFILD